MDYRVVESLRVSDLVKVVKDAIGEGWEPQGGMGMNSHYSYQGNAYGQEFRHLEVSYYQALVKRAP
jgi:hypothetical protein